MEILIERYPAINDNQTIGNAYVLNDDGVVIHSFKTLELPDRQNKVQVSRIPKGRYKCIKRWSKKYKNHFHVLNVEGRTYILIHAGNYYYNTLGCILVGEDFEDLNNDGLLDVTDSVKTMKKLNKILPKEFTLNIVELDGVELKQI